MTIYLEHILGMRIFTLYSIVTLYTLGNGIITSESVEKAMRAVDRGNYCPFNPYYDSPQSIGYQATISAPHMVSINVDACMHACICIDC